MHIPQLPGQMPKWPHQARELPGSLTVGQTQLDSVTFLLLFGHPGFNFTLIENKDFFCKFDWLREIARLSLSKKS